MLIKGLSCRPDTLAGALAQFRHTQHTLTQWCLGQGSSLCTKGNSVFQRMQREGLRPGQNSERSVYKWDDSLIAGVVLCVKVYA